ncbi:MAG: trypsin-like peptidase domain-containing protein [Patescibacteria group bacterium]|nr:trypsin-like peptidase domain-containing protein [Patescibacteria group bacterium]
MKKILKLSSLVLVAFFVLSGCSLPSAISRFLPAKSNQANNVQQPTAENSALIPSSTAANPENQPVASPAPAAIPVPLVKEEAFKGVVKIKTLSLDQTGALSEIQNGSGVVISSDGFLLTNSHVVTVEDDLDKSDKPAVYGICLTTNTSVEPDCSHLAELVIKDKDLDIALLHLLNAPAVSPYLDLMATDTASTSEEVTALGYPGIGQDTITITKGVVSGKLDKYGKSWIKTDAVISFGSSGGAAVDKNGQVMGITTAGYSDTLGELGYIINSASIIDWVKKGEAAYQPAAANPLNDRGLKFLQKQKDLETADVFTSDYPGFSLTKPSDWAFEYTNEDNLMIFNKKEEDKSGSVLISAYREPHLLSAADIIPIFKKELQQSLTLIKIGKEQAADINGTKGEKITISGGGQSKSLYFFPWREYLLSINYDYGENEKDQATVDSIINSLKTSVNTSPFSEIFAYQSADPVFGLNSIKGWPMLIQTEKGAPVVIKSKTSEGSFVELKLEQKTAETKNLNNEEILANYQQIVDSANQLGGQLDMEIKLVSQNTSYKINDEFPQALKMEVQVKKKSTGEIMEQDLQYDVSLNDKYNLTVVLEIFSKDKKAYNAAAADFSKIAQSLTLKPAVDSDHDGLSDAQEAQLGTDPRNPDTDGDGYLDGSEVVNGYNPLGK